MSRFLIYPPLFAAWLAAAQFLIEVLGYLGSWFSLRFIPQNVDIYWHEFHLSVMSFLPIAIVGLIVGCIVAALDFSTHRGIRTAEESTIRLFRELAKSVAFAMGLVLVCQVLGLMLSFQEGHRRYHAYSPEMTWLNWLGFLQPLALGSSVLWAIGRALKRS